MEKVYLYQKHDWNTDFFIRHERLSREERYCSYCEAYDTLIGVYDTEAGLSRKLKWLFNEGFDVTPSEEYDEIRDKYCPPLLRQWDLQKLEGSPEEYNAMAGHLAGLERSFNMEGLEYKETGGRVNPYYYINSGDIRAHLRSLNYEFSALETAWLIWQSAETALDDRHRAWRKLIETMPDYPIKERLGTVLQESLHAFLKKQMDTEKRLLDLFCRSGDEAVYSFRYHEPGARDWEECETLFYGGNDSGWAICTDAMDEQVELADRIVVRKRWLNGVRGEIEAELDGLRRICRIRSEEVNDEEFSCLHRGFDGLWFDFPTPFRRGDILVSSDGVPFVLERICTWTQSDANWECGSDPVLCKPTDGQMERWRACGDVTDMHCQGYFVSTNGRIYHAHHPHNYMDMEYYCGELAGYQRVLKAVSNYLKGRIRLDVLLNACQIIRSEETVANDRLFLGVNDDWMELAGLR